MSLPLNRFVRLSKVGKPSLIGIDSDSDPEYKRRSMQTFSVL
jgi:hypothetical protein